MTQKLQTILKAASLEHLYGTLVDQGVVDSMLADLSEDDLRSLGIDKIGERKRLLSVIEESTISKEKKSLDQRQRKDREASKLDYKEQVGEGFSANPTIPPANNSEPDVDVAQIARNMLEATKSSAPILRKLLGFFLLGPLMLVWPALKRKLQSRNDSSL
jgi:hypothetical protein